MDDMDLNQLLYREQHALLMAQISATPSVRARHCSVARVFGGRISALRFPLRTSVQGGWTPYLPAPLERG